MSEARDPAGSGWDPPSAPAGAPGDTHLPRTAAEDDTPPESGGSVPGMPDRPGPGEELHRDADWQRLDPRMLFVHPVKELVRFVPVLIAVFVIGSANGPAWWQVAAIAVPVALGVLRYLTTTFRVAQGQVQLRRGLFERHRLAVPLDRVRTVDLSASIFHRLLGLTTIKVGTGSASSDADEQLDLDALPTPRAEQLRRELLRGATTAPAPEGAHARGPGEPPPPPAPPVASFRLGWLRYAPLTGGGLAIAGATIGLGVQFVTEFGIDVDTTGLPDRVTWWLVVLGLLAFAVVVLALSVFAYAAAYWGLTLSHPWPGAPWHVRRGLFTTRETSIDEDRLAGVSVGEGLVLRAAGAAKLGAIVTGLRSDSTLVPPCPKEVGSLAAAAILGEATAVTGPLTGHGPLAVRRRYTRALIPTAVLSLAVLLVGLDPLESVPVDLGWATWLSPLPILIGLGLAVDRSRSLGHALAGSDRRLLVARSGSMLRRRDVLSTEHVIGWTFRSSWFQRRAALATTVATTAGGRQQVTVLDVPERDAVVLADRAVPGLVSQFLAPPPAP
ncbi:PH domain-containing protein [Nocardioides insulae]|uniref:PH domain-containing protein n=1 Tax=Nocardioides insulae TaxID=394734 RepID=UPI0006854D9D|nr:PH domain-containing protein [Nocardioides insulae]